MQEFDKVVPFKNWTTTKFEGLYGGEHYKFEAGGTYSVPLSLAEHFAKQLAVRELHALGTSRGEMLADPDMKEYMDKCFPVKQKANHMSGEFERLDIVTDEEAKPADTPADANTTIEEEQQEIEDEEDSTADDEKNNAGAPVFKNKGGRPRKDAMYVK